MSRKRGRITVQHQPTGAARGMQRLMGVVHAVFGIVFVIVAATQIMPGAGLIGLPFLVAGAFFAINGIRIIVSKNGMAHRVAYDVEQDMAESIVGILEDAPETVDIDTGPTGTTEARLLELKRLYDQDLITYDEYEMKRKDILEEL